MCITTYVLKNVVTMGSINVCIKTQLITVGSKYLF